MLVFWVCSLGGKLARAPSAGLPDGEGAVGTGAANAARPLVLPDGEGAVGTGARREGGPVVSVVSR